MMKNTLMKGFLEKIRLRSAIFCLMITTGLIFTGCDNGNQYNKGYEAAWNGEKEPSSFWSSSEEKMGYQDGLSDAYMYEDGYYDGKSGQKPRYAKDPDYMDGFKDGKIIKREFDL